MQKNNEGREMLVCVDNCGVYSLHCNRLSRICSPRQRYARTNARTLELGISATCLLVFPACDSIWRHVTLRVVLQLHARTSCVYNFLQRTASRSIHLFPSKYVTESAYQLVMRVPRTICAAARSVPPVHAFTSLFQSFIDHVVGLYPQKCWIGYIDF